MDLGRADPKGLVRESYAIEGITAPECRSIFLDWALGLAAGTDQHEAMRSLLGHYGAAAPDHPMTRIMREGLGAPDRPLRRGGRAARMGRDSAQGG
ncbi:MAG: hypothetical protein N2422_11750 [Rhodobacteraceae bacterium]|nr:hypothetical protein [Paracoccaceae bacterium]